MAGKKKTHAQYCAELKEMGHWVVPLESYKGATTPILHQCKKHGEALAKRPKEILRGEGLRCCWVERNQAGQTRRKEKAAADYVESLAKMGKVELVDEYQGCMVKVAHRCLTHGEVHLVKPNSVLSNGGGLRCCLKDAVRSFGDRLIREASESYAARLAEIGKVVALEEYKGTRVSIMHRCLTHGVEQLASPVQTLAGKGLKCCQQAAREEAAKAKIERAAKTYEARLAEHGKVELLGEYKGTRTKALHRCLVHGEVHMATPQNLLHGHGLQCCMEAAGAMDSYLRFCNEPELAESPCKLYVAQVNGAYLKPGIATDTNRRSGQSRGFYKGYDFVSPTLTRAEAWVLEQCLHVLSEAAKPDTLPKEYDDWAGRTELRLKDVYPATWYIARYHELVEELAEIGWEELYLKYQEQTLN